MKSGQFSERNTLFCYPSGLTLAEVQENQEVQGIRSREVQEIRRNPGVGGIMNPLAGLAGVALLMGLAVQFSLHRLALSRAFLFKGSGLHLGLPWLGGQLSLMKEAVQKKLL